jgi:hypothetical protein
MEKGIKIRTERGRKMLVDRRRRFLEHARSVSKLASMIAAIAPTSTKTSIGICHKQK